MPIEPIPDMSLPEARDRVWRYMDFPKYLSMLDRRALYFSNVEALARTDPHEGMLAQPNFRHRDWQDIRDLTHEEWQELGMGELDDAAREIQFWRSKSSREYWARRRFYDRRAFFVNCWHVSEYESAAMWPAYADPKQGIAVTADYSLLVDALTPANERILAAKVRYVDFVTEPVGPRILPTNKRLSFSYEKELRLIYWDPKIREAVNHICHRLAISMFPGGSQSVRTEEIDWELVEDEVARVAYTPGRYVPVDIEALVSEVRVSPMAEDWFVDLVRSVSKRYSVNADITRSDLLSSPLR